MNYTEKTQVISVTEQDGIEIQFPAGWQEYKSSGYIPVVRLELSEALYRILRGMQYATEQEFSKSILRGCLTGQRGLRKRICIMLGRLS